MNMGGILSVHLEAAYTEAELVETLCSLFGLQPDDLAPLDAMDVSTRVPYQVVHRTRGFLTSLELYVGRAPEIVPRSDLDLAVALARHYCERVLIPPRDADPNPYTWEMVTADDSPRRVQAIPQNDDCIVLASRPAT
jgi:hypothetical protein